MTRKEAIEYFKKIQGGSGVDRNTFPDELKGEIAKRKLEGLK